MTQANSPSRGSALKVASWLVEKGRAPEAVAMLSALAAAGPNDAEGQLLLAEAFRLDASAPVARHAFAHMEGLPGNRPELDAAVARWTEAEVGRLLRELNQPSFNRAQVGFNNNVKYNGHVFHIQTEDSGLSKPHIITHLFADGGRIIKSHKRSYAESVSRVDVGLYVKGLMKGQQMEMIVALRDGKFDPVIAGEAVGGMQVFDSAPNVELKRLGKRPDAGDAPATAPVAPVAPVASPRAQQVVRQAPRPNAKPIPQPLPAATLESTSASPQADPGFADSDDAPATQRISTHPDAIELIQPAEPDAVALVRPAQARFRVEVLRSMTGGPSTYEPKGDEVIIGASGSIALKGDRFCHATEAIVRWRDNALWIEDIEGGNGVFWRVRTPVELEPGDEFLVGDQLLRIDRNPQADDGPDPDPTYFYSSPKWASSFRVVQVFEGGASGACVVARGTTLTIGAMVGDLVFSDDPLVSDQHCVVEEQAGSIVLTDMQSRTGVFVRVKTEQLLEDGDQIVVGRTRLLFDLSPRSRA